MNAKKVREATHRPGETDGSTRPTPGYRRKPPLAEWDCEADDNPRGSDILVCTMSESITKVSWLKRGTSSKVSKRESAFFKHESAVRFAKQLESEKGISDIKLEIDLGIKDVR